MKVTRDRGGGGSREHDVDAESDLDSDTDPDTDADESCPEHTSRLTPHYFVMVNDSVFEIDWMPDGAVGLKVTNAEWILWPTSTGMFGT